MEAVTDLEKGIEEENRDKNVPAGCPSEEANAVLQAAIAEAHGRCFVSLKCIDSETGKETILVVADLDVRDTMSLVFHGEDKASEAEVFTFSFLEENMRNNAMNRRDRNELYQDLELQFAEELSLLDSEQHCLSEDGEEMAADGEYVPYGALSIADKLDVIQSDLQCIKQKMFGGVLGPLLRKIC